MKVISHKITVKVENRASYEIPSAGGTGIYIFNLAGAFLITLSVLLYFRRRRAIKDNVNM